MSERGEIKTIGLVAAKPRYSFVHLNLVTNKLTIVENKSNENIRYRSTFNWYGIWSIFDRDEVSENFAFGIEAKPEHNIGIGVA